VTNDTQVPQVPIKPPTDGEPEPADVVDFQDPGDGRVWRDWWTPFLQELALTANVSQSAKRAGISRQYANRERQKHEHFALMWVEAEAQAADLLRQVARVRATVGEKTEVETIKEEFDTVVKPDGTVEQVLRSRTRAVTVRMERSNALLVRQLVAYCPEFKEAREVRHGGIPGEAVEVRLPERTPERVRRLAETMLELGIGREGADAE
jgi:hypothetical protein